MAPCACNSEWSPSGGFDSRRAAARVRNPPPISGILSQGYVRKLLGGLREPEGDRNIEDRGLKVHQITILMD